MQAPASWLAAAYDRYGLGAYQLAIRITGTPSAAADVLVDAFCVLASEIESSAAFDSVELRIRKLTCHLAIARLRSAKRARDEDV